MFCGNNPVNFRDPSGLCKGGDDTVFNAGLQGWISHQGGVLNYFMSGFESTQQIANMLHLPGAIPTELTSTLLQGTESGFASLNQNLFGMAPEREGICWLLGKVSAFALSTAATIQASGSSGDMLRGRDALRAEQRLIKAAMREAGLAGKSQRQILHRAISGQGLNYAQVVETARDIAAGLIH